MANKELAEILASNKVKALSSEAVSNYISLGYSAAKPLNYFTVTETVRSQTAEVAIRMKLSAEASLRVIGWYGPPGTGKDALAKEIAACLQMPFVEFDLGYGSDVLELVGGTGLNSTEGGTETVSKPGPLTRAAQAGAMIALNEVVNVDGIQLSVLHAMIQDRKISLHSVEARQEIPVNAHTFFVFTWNPDIRNPDRQMPPPALLDRIRARRFDFDSQEDEVKKLGAYLRNALGPKVVNNEAITKDVKLIRELRQAYNNLHLARCPYMRTLQDFSLTRISLGTSAAFRVLENLCDQEPQEFRVQRSEVLKKHFEPIFGSVD